MYGLVPAKDSSETFPLFDGFLSGSDWPVSGGVTQLKDSGSFSSNPSTPQRKKKGLLRAVVANHHHRR